MNEGDSVHEIKATVWIGKQGLTESVIEEVILQLEKRHRVKVKWLRNADFDPRTLAERASANSSWRGGGLPCSKIKK